MGAISKPGLKRQVKPVIEFVPGTDSIIPVVLGLQFYCKWDSVKTGQAKIKYTLVFFIGIQVHAADPEPPTISEQAYTRLN